MIAFGPVPSRRLGRSLGINNIPAKRCSYSCVYCQAGATLKTEIERREFYEPELIFRAVLEKVEKALKADDPIDYLTFVADGEPTLDLNLGTEIRLLRRLGMRVAVITNASLLRDEKLQEEVAEADWVSVKIDTVREDTWRKLNRPQPSLRLSSVLEGIGRFSQAFRGELVTETMVVQGLNDSAAHLRDLADVLLLLNPRCSYVAIPTRPPAEAWVRPPTGEVLAGASSILTSKIEDVRFLPVDEGEWFTRTGRVEQDFMSITAVHPMREKAAKRFVENSGADWCVIEQLVDDGVIVIREFGGDRFYWSPPRNSGDTPLTS